MKEFFKVENGSLFFKYRYETVWVMPWGNGLRVRATQNQTFTSEDWALTMPADAQAEITVTEEGATVKNGKIRLEMSPYGRMRFSTTKTSCCSMSFTVAGTMVWITPNTSTPSPT